MAPHQKSSPAAPLRTRRRLAAVIAAFGLVAGATALPAVADEPETTARVIRTDSYLGGSLLVTQADVGTLAFTDCRSGFTCIWDSPLYIGILFQYNNPGNIITLPSITVASYANKRSYRTKFYELLSGAGNEKCAAPNTQNQSVAGWLLGARSMLQHSTATSC
ncbi:hypothetical protein ACGIF2_13140 [Cellulomonas sp. P22]|uniref:hypothetical protein n=1 Tax=Cellulomonas sp. P22 TaxID=3373189 RepID=UPI0037BD7244